MLKLNGRFEVNPEYVGQLEAHGMKFVGRDTENVRMEIMELNGPGMFYKYDWKESREG